MKSSRKRWDVSKRMSKRKPIDASEQFGIAIIEKHMHGDSISAKKKKIEFKLMKQQMLAEVAVMSQLCQEEAVLRVFRNRRSWYDL